MKALIYFTCLVVFQTVFAQKPLPNAHAHNDYAHKVPLQEALSQGFTSVEADVWLINNELYISHNFPKNLTGITLNELYLKPLQKHLQENEGKVYKSYEGVFFLTIDIKAKGEEVYQVLRKQILEIPDFQHNRYLKIFLSGDRPIETVKNDSLKLTGIDGRPEYLGKGYNTDFMPVISDTYRKFCKWNGVGQMPESEFLTLQNLAEKVHRENKKLRLWAIPDNENTWKTLLKAGVDLINTDKLKALNQFLTEN
ncbi:MAG: hypothetical protein H7Y04_06415 [Verrucomicrobia bacterium]|nr:hypothetical protein [Cytophagales bacterium]